MLPGDPQLETKPDARLAVATIAKLMQADHLGFICNDPGRRQRLAIRLANAK
jgi:hypothetical protein